jgi:hypothetical protein
MGFNKRKMEDARRQEAEKEGAARRETEKQITVWKSARPSGRQWRRHHDRLSVPMGPRSGQPHHRDEDLRLLDWRRVAAVTAFTPSLSCRSIDRTGNG